MTRKRTAAAPLFHKSHLTVLSAVLFGVEGQDGACKNSPRTSLGKILFPGVQESMATRRVDRILKDSVVDTLMAVFDEDIALLPTRDDREFVWRVRQRYPEGMEQFLDAIYDFERGRGLPPYEAVQVPLQEVESKQEEMRARGKVA